MNFCETCNNLLVFVNKNSKMVSHCNICNVDYPFNGHIISSKTYNVTTNKNEILSKQALIDDTFPRFLCKKCNKLVRGYKDANLKMYIVCPDCK